MAEEVSRAVYVLVWMFIASVFISWTKFGRVTTLAVCLVIDSQKSSSICGSQVNRVGYNGSVHDFLGPTGGIAGLLSHIG
jgi:hypothetical protein